LLVDGLSLAEFRLEQANETYHRLKSRGAKFHMVLTMSWADARKTAKVQSRDDFCCPR